MPIYEFRCKTCDKRFEVNRPSVDHSCTECCGPLVRVWAVNVNTANLRAARG